MFVKTGDKVKVIAGKDKGKEGVVVKIIAASDRVLVEGVNMMKKHQKPSNQYPQGGIIEQEAPIHVSNVQLLDPSTNEPARFGIKIEDGKKVRVSKKSGTAL
ncbi:50S ribosomal protein L24 [Weissella koreensis]|uniref:Large ribosomal subunit protein uL24 n=1 Tax=Weissella koreensis TaxID=165096 RepID=A0A7H1MLB1_9LACO|nr:50S ribosomal protein L24 [Weissella koreensis]AVH75043.1 50S ribosomal protein L24 [Weissella koreensis]EJF33451.1 ribosomal protein L24 [Weissella koreensis KCTC 3621]MCZ9310918.1 50S ribosomal protein L24 [Weissella koreensis]QGN20269.1 50S ribosomal protein L24 [Weissella koreensis]QNT64247.1 50S ribosomal protein L24 [Weissella koreensis]